jgi:hypothetical protein
VTIEDCEDDAIVGRMASNFGLAKTGKTNEARDCRLGEMIKILIVGKEKEIGHVHVPRVRLTITRGDKTELKLQYDPI